MRRWIVAAMPFAAALVAVAAAQAIPMGAYGNISRFDRLTGQRTADAMTARLRSLGMPGVRTDVPVSRYPNMTVVWNPLAVGVSAVGGNGYRDYFAGLKYLDAYGNNYYNTSGVYAFRRTEDLYKAFPTKPFMFPEWGLAVDDPGYIEAFGTFLRRHRRVRFPSFFNGPVGSAYDLGRKPRNLAAYRRFITPLSR